jgi:hypothetical protein
MAALSLVEAAVSFAAIYAVTTLADPSLSLPDFVATTAHDHLALAAVLTPIGAKIRFDAARRGLILGTDAKHSICPCGPVLRALEAAPGRA